MHYCYDAYTYNQQNIMGKILLGEKYVCKANYTSAFHISLTTGCTTRGRPCVQERSWETGNTTSVIVLAQQCKGIRFLPSTLSPYKAMEWKSETVQYSF